MNKTFQINLGGVPFTIDDDAYRRLDLYMHELESHFADSVSRDEIIADIEARLAELLTENMRGRNIVDLRDIANAIKIMGQPGDFDEEPFAEAHDSRGSNTWDIKTGKRLFRDPEDKVIGGVCSGLSAYLGIEDPIWMRLGFVIIFITGGFGLLAYLVAWALIPEAKTASDRLAMMGHPANVNNIANMVEKGLDDLSDTIRDNFQGLKKKDKGSGRYYMQRSHPLRSDVLILDKPSIPTKLINTAKRKLNDLLSTDDSLYV